MAGVQSGSCRIDLSFPGKGHWWPGHVRGMESGNGISAPHTDSQVHCVQPHLSLHLASVIPEYFWVSLKKFSLFFFGRLLLLDFLCYTNSSSNLNIWTLVVISHPMSSPILIFFSMGLSVFYFFHFRTVWGSREGRCLYTFHWKKASRLCSFSGPRLAELSLLISKADLKNRVEMIFILSL